MTRSHRLLSITPPRARLFNRTGEPSTVLLGAFAQFGVADVGQLKRGIKTGRVTPQAFLKLRGAGSPTNPGLIAKRLFTRRALREARQQAALAAPILP